MANNVIKRVWNQNRMVAIEDLKGMTFQTESGGHTFQISGVDDAGNTVALSGSVAGVFLRPDNTDVAITGSASGGVVSVTLLPECYDIPGRFGLTVFVTDNGQKTAVYAAVGTVSRTSSGAVSPGTTSNVIDLINQINAAVATIPASWTGLMADIAPTYSASAVYPVGAYCYYNGDLYRCTTAITTAESWTAGHWIPAVLGQDVSDLKQALSVLPIASEKAFGNYIGVWSVGYYSTPASGSSVTFSNNVNFVSTVIPVTEGDIVTLNASSTTGNNRLYVFMDGDGNAIGRCDTDLSGERTITAPANAVKVAINNRLSSQETGYYAYLGENISTRLSEKQDTLTFDSVPTDTSLNPVTSTGLFHELQDNLLRLDRTTINIPSNSDLNNYTQAGNYHVLNNATAGTISNMPVTAPGKLIVLYTTSPTNFWQFYFRADSFNIYYRYKTQVWRVLSNSSLMSTNDQQDRSAEIRGLLNSGVCRLDKGDFYVSGVEMPDGSSIIGSGSATRIILLDSVASGAAIKMGSNCTVQDCSIIGGTAEIDTSYSDVESITIGTRHGILWLGEATESDSSANNHYRGTVSKCYINGFTGGGITCEMTGYETNAGINASDCQIWNCGAGINISYWSEFNRFTNVNCTDCRYGVINNGGNNTFANCGFSSNEIGFYTNGDENKAVKYNGTTATVKNGGHGTLSCCVINHSGRGSNLNHGYAIFYKTIDSGFVFDGMQIFYGKIYFRGGSHVMITNTNFGNSVDLIIYTGRIFYMFNTCYFRSNAVAHPYDTSGNPITTFNEDGNTDTIKLLNCYTQLGNAVSLRTLAENVA